MDTEEISKGILNSAVLYAIAGLVIVIISCGDIPSIRSRYRKLPGAPIVGAKSRFEPAWLTRYRFTLSGWAIVNDGWKNVQSGVFTVIRPDSNVTVIPRKYVDELSSIPDHRLAASEPIVNDMMRQYTRSDILLGGHLGHHAVKNKLSPQLGNLVGLIEEELLIAASEEPLDVTTEWSEHKLSHYVSRLMGRVTSRLFLGVPICRNPTWLQLQLDLVKAIFETTVIMRNLPRFTHPVVGALLPSRKRLLKCMNGLHCFLIPLIEERRAKEKTQDPSYEKPRDVMEWMMELANEEESEPSNLANRFVYTILGSVQTVVEVIMNCIYELCVRPGYIEPLREEMRLALREDNGWGKRTASKLIRTDSFIKEISRHYPPSALSFRRITKEAITLSDGLVLPKDTYICVATTSPEQDELGETDQAEFDGYRYYRKRLAQNSPSSRYDYASTDKSHVSFGHGRYACPGRFAASIEVKLLLAHILLHYDVRLSPRMSCRPQSIKILEFQFLDPEATVELRTIISSGH
ncbi:cytochrome P450 [Hypoxylon sp. FL0890]|nr:cytochrome P450 [Hypoxylon sp. FL0890]